MEIVDLLAAFSDPAAMKSLSANQRLMAGLITTVLGMGITFLALIILQIVTALFSKLSPVEHGTTTTEVSPASTEPAEKTADDHYELIAAITSSLALMLEKPAEEIVIKSIKRVEAPISAWSRAGISEQVHNSV